MFRKILPLFIVTNLYACGAQSSEHANVVKFGDILKPYYETVLAETKCDDWQDVKVSVFDQQGHHLSFSYGSCNDDTENGDTEGEMTSFTYKSNFANLGGYVFGKYKYPTPKSTFESNPNADKYMHFDVPIIGITRLGAVSVEEYLKNKKIHKKIDWDICKIKVVGDHIWTLDNPSFKEVPYPDYMVGNYENFKEWKINHKADEAKYRKKYGEQLLKNRACVNEQHSWYIAKDGILIILFSPDTFTRGVNPTSVVYTTKN